MSEYGNALCGYGIGAKDAACALKEAMIECEKAAREALPFLIATIQHDEIMRCATPHEIRMMHNKRRRIRKKYYNRVKRRIGL